MRRYKSSWRSNIVVKPFIDASNKQVQAIQHGEGTHTVALKEGNGSPALMNVMRDSIVLARCCRLDRAVDLARRKEKIKSRDVYSTDHVSGQ